MSELAKAELSRGSVWSVYLCVCVLGRPVDLWPAGRVCVGFHGCHSLRVPVGASVMCVSSCMGVWVCVGTSVMCVSSCVGIWVCFVCIPYLCLYEYRCVMVLRVCSNSQ